MRKYSEPKGWRSVQAQVWMTAIQEGLLNPVQESREKAAGQFPRPPLLLKLDRLMERPVRNRSQDSVLLPPPHLLQWLVLRL